MKSRLPRAAVAVLALAASGVSAALTTPITQGSVSVRLQTLVTGPGGALDLTHAGDGSNRLFVANQGGQVRLIQNNALQPTPFLDLPVTLGSTFPTPVSERGLLGISFHPDFNAPAGTPGAGKFYTFTSETKVGTPDFTHPEIGDGGGTHHAVVREWSVNASNPNVVDTSQGSRPLLRIAWPADNHIGGALKFGPDKNLYVSLGDGGNGDDLGTGHTNGIGNGQDTSNVYGDILRINPIASVASNGNLSANGQYRIPTDNPFVNAAGVDEIYAYGFRNPFRMSFDRKTGALYVGDVGQGWREEVDVVQKGKNYGWFYFEGSLVKNANGPSDTVFPIAEYINRAQGSTGEGNAVIGGFVYRGFRHPDLHGKYVFGDFAGKFGPGRLFYLDAGNVIREFRYDANSVVINSGLRGFGEGPTGELHALFTSGQVLQLGGGPVQWEANGSGTWQTASNWSNNVVPNGIGAVANLMGGLATPNAAPAVVTLTNTARVGTLRFFNDTVNPNGSSPYTYVLEGPPAGLDIQTTDASVFALIAADAGHHLINTGVSTFAHTELRVAENSSLTFAEVFNNNNGRTIRKTGLGTVNFDSLPTGSFTVLDVQQGTVTGRAVSSETISVKAGARLAVQRLFNVRNLNVDAGGEAKLSVQTPVTEASMVSNLFVAGGTTPTGTLDLNHRLRTSVPDLATLAAQIRYARNGGAYDRPGITSEIAENSNGTMGVGLLPDGTLDVTYFGDSDLDKDLDADDYHRLDSAFLQRLSGWHNGDADHSGVIDLLDYALVDYAYRSINPEAAAAMIDQHTLAFGPAYAAALAAVPEPVLAPLLLCGAPLLARRRRG